MDIAESRRGDIVILKLGGRLDSGTSNEFQERLLALIDGGEKRLVIDLARIDYVSSAGLRAFLVGAKRLKGAGGKIALCSLKSNIKEVFDLSGFSSLFPAFPSVEGAVSNV